jgi:hypothetical protein
MLAEYTDSRDILPTSSSPSPEHHDDRDEPTNEEPSRGGKCDCGKGHPPLRSRISNAANMDGWGLHVGATLEAKFGHGGCGVREVQKTDEWAAYGSGYVVRHVDVLFAQIDQNLAG